MLPEYSSKGNVDANSVGSFLQPVACPSLIHENSNDVFMWNCVLVPHVIGDTRYANRMSIALANMKYILSEQEGACVCVCGFFAGVAPLVE
jgi:hypothetical protein